MARRGLELYMLTTEKFRELKPSYRPQLKLKFAILILKEIADVIANYEADVITDRSPWTAVLRKI